MAPQKKRGAQDSEEVCKRIKDDIKEAKVVAEQSAAAENNSEVVDKSATDKSNNNNNNNNNGVDSKNNGNVKHESSDSKESKVDQEKHVNGASKVEEASGESDSDKPVKSETTTASSNQTDVKGDSNQSEPTKPTTECKEEETKDESSTDAASGILLICGGANWDMTGRKELPKASKKPVEVDPAARNLWGPHRVCLDGKNLRVKGVFSGCNACHSVIVTDDGHTMAFGRNDKGQLGVGDTNTRVTPVLITALEGIDIVAAACGRSHTLFLASDGIVYATGDNKMGQCGTNQQSVHTIMTPVRIAFRENKRVVKVACGAEFSMIVDEDGRLYSFGHPEYGQLGHNSEGKYFTSGNKYAFHCEYQPRRIVTYIEKSREGHVSPAEDVSIVDVACGTNHTLAVDTKHRCFSWGFAGYHRLGHSETKNEMVPRSIRLFDVPASTGRGCAKVFAGATFSMALDLNGLLYFWGQNKSSGEATMYPKNVQDLCGWRISSVACANRSIFIVAEDTCISWGPSPTYGELGYGEGKSKSSTTPIEVKSLDGAHIINIACGYGHTLLIARDRNPDEVAHIEKSFNNWP